MLYLYINFAGVPALYGFKGTRTYEVMKFSDKFRSWFCNDSVHEGGFGLYDLNIRYYLPFVTLTILWKLKYNDNNILKFTEFFN